MTSRCSLREQTHLSRSERRLEAQRMKKGRSDHFDADGLFQEAAGLDSYPLRNVSQAILSLSLKLLSQGSRAPGVLIPSPLSLARN